MKIFNYVLLVIFIFSILFNIPMLITLINYSSSQNTVAYKYTDNSNIEYKETFSNKDKEEVNNEPSTIYALTINIKSNTEFLKNSYNKIDETAKYIAGEATKYIIYKSDKYTVVIDVGIIAAFGLTICILIYVLKRLSVLKKG